MFTDYYQQDLPFAGTNETAENQHRNFCFEEQETKRFVKQLTITLLPNETTAMVVILKAPYQESGPIVGLVKLNCGTYVQKDLQRCQKRTMES